ncbi:MAG: ATP-binding cassette domain-containing protein, partial [Betaproteobacteria bacterium]|nr:ATP-binding cassette domain-containing protein [Betaproteobacteria bacterium]
VREFSGGWRMRINLARALMRKSDLMLLDEPTNHLDLDAVLWLERWLASYRGTLFIISHDRELLDATVTEILHFDQQGLKQYTGSYADFESQRAMTLSQNAAAYARQQREIAHLQSFVDRFRAKATKAKQAQSRLKALERMERIAPAHVDSPFEFSFREPPSASDPLLKIEECRAGYEDVTILDNIMLSVRAGARYGLLGRNGAGKSTLIQLVAGTIPPQAGTRLEGKGVRIGYFAQHQVEALDFDASPLLNLARADKAMGQRTREQELRDFLGGFNFPGDTALEPVRRLSGGEKARVALALIIWLRPNLLLLDEPTNHLDIEMREALTEALQGYLGAIVLVSHDRHLVRTTCDEFLLVADGAVTPYDGDLDDYQQGLAARRSGMNDSGTAASPAEKTAKAPSRKDERGSAAAARDNRAKNIKALEKRAAILETKMSGLNAELARIDAQLASPGFFGDGTGDAVVKALKDRERVAGEVDAAEADWLKLQVEMEEGQAAAASRSNCTGTSPTSRCPLTAGRSCARSSD